jgi:hypothetical protein
MSAESQRTCPSCGNEFPETMEFCPVCMLRKGLAGGVESGESFFEEAVKPTPDRTAKRFEHYELVRGEDGKPVELGRGAMASLIKRSTLICSVLILKKQNQGQQGARDF